MIFNDWVDDLVFSNEEEQTNEWRDVRWVIWLEKNTGGRSNLQWLGGRFFFSNEEEWTDTNRCEEEEGK